MRTLDQQLARHRGDPVGADAAGPPATHPLFVIAPHLAPTTAQVRSWNEVFEAWCGYVVGRPKSTIIAYSTARIDLRRFAAACHVRSPGEVTPVLTTQFVENMRTRDRALAVSTIIYRRAPGGDCRPRAERSAP